MKKKLVLLIILLLFPYTIHAGYMDTQTDWTLYNDIFAHQMINGTDKVTKLNIKTANGKIAYCIDPGIKAERSLVYSSTNNINDVKPGIDSTKLILIGYYGYQYNNHNDIKYYMAAQELIWNYLGLTNTWWTDINGNKIDINTYKTEILSLVNNYNKTPIFNFNKNYIVGDVINLNDNNNVINEYEVANNKNVKITNNGIQIKITDNNNFILQRKVLLSTTTYYYKEGYQSLASFGSPNILSKTYNINSVYGSISLNKYDYNTKINKPTNSNMSLENAKYGLYDSNLELIKESLTNDKGEILFDNLTEGEYVIKEINPSIGYSIDKSTYRVFINNFNRNSIVKSYEKPISKLINVKLLLDDLDKGIISPRPNEPVNVSDKQNTLSETYNTNNDGDVSIRLYYGEYIIKVNDKKLFILVNNEKDDNYVITEVLQSRKSNKIDNKTEQNNEKETLPNTGYVFNNNIILIIIIILLLLLIGFRYEKKNI